MIGNKKGFTLIEMIIAMGIFIISIFIVSSSFVYISKVNESIVQVEKAQSEAKFILEYLVSTIKNNYINYDYYEEEGSYVFDVKNELALKNDFGEEIYIKEECKNIDTDCYVVIKKDNHDYIAISSENIEVNFFGFLIRPLIDPFKWDEVNNRFVCEKIKNGDIVSDDCKQSIVLIKLKVSPKGDNIKNINLQTIVSLRKYR